VATAAAGVLFVVSALSADGTDLRSVTTDVRTLVVDRGADVDAARTQVEQLREEIDDLTADVDDAMVEAAQREERALEPGAGLREVRGAGLRITLTDAPREAIEESGRDPKDLVVHQQDIQAFVNAMWAAGAEGVSLMGQRLISTTAIKCVGNTVLLQGVPYSPPYVIEAVGDTSAMYERLDDSDRISVYEEYVAVYGLGLEIELVEELTIPAYEGVPELEHAEAVSR
jgi:uncharacterized protein YlxW (UPF0749 family)